MIQCSIVIYDMLCITLSNSKAQNSQLQHWYQLWLHRESFETKCIHPKNMIVYSVCSFLVHTWYVVPELNRRILLHYGLVWLDPN